MSNCQKYQKCQNIKISKYQNVKDFKNFKKCQEICKKLKKISITLDNPKTSKTKGGKMHLLISKMW